MPVKSSGADLRLMLAFQHPLLSNEEIDLLIRASELGAAPSRPATPAPAGILLPALT